MPAKIKGSVTITIHPDGTHTLDPPMGFLDRTIQIMQWSLVAPNTQTMFANTPIVFDQPEGFDPWKGDVIRENHWQVRANARQGAPTGTKLRYHYTIFVVLPDGSTIPINATDPETTEAIDPIIENQPEP